MRPPLIVGNWKMHKTIREAREYVGLLRVELKETADRQVVLAPPFTALGAVAEALAGTGIELAAQNVCDRDEGAATGEVSARMLAEAGCRHVLIGHSERRAYYGEDDALINRKLKSALQHGLQPILCIGETLSQREADQTFDVATRQLQEGLRGVGLSEATRAVVAYEPIWAIGTGLTASPEQAAAMHVFIRGVVSSIYGENFGLKVPVIYGGSVNPANIKALMAQREINGVLVGGASLEAKSFSRIVKF